ncbi:MAG: bifunctional (p)ppGpp synthetase/guanosine-3',5'-bis(diphosphate) 3'-pyrophosphohydrolase [Anaerolineae bacterium]|jgi:GTP pyrophosphokinase|nr:bifunctional (p)ppGpp synthetase/guanosine-3',5'-bis(diphosphate) 3'-pyrophosphohydrolase [Anaerolineae bacterium]
MSPTVATPTDLQSLVENLPDLTPNDYTLIARAYQKAEIAHAGQTRKSGEPYFTHCVAVAGILADMKLDAEAISAALMHDIIEDTPVTLEDLEQEFGSVIAMLVDGVTKLKNLPLPTEKDNAGKKSSSVNRELEYIRKMLLTMGDDVRVVLIKLADRLHNMRTLGYMKPERQRVIARETLDIFTPLANRLGIWQIKWELEDLSLRYVEPEIYKSIASSIDERRTDRERYMAAIAETLRTELQRSGINATISSRPKHIYSIYKKMNRKDLPFEQIYDVRAVRVIVDNISQCYQTLGVVHNLWRPIPGEFDDYIAGPKDNFYQSLHTAVIDLNGKTVEVQIRTWEMHEHAEYGIAAHWRYKEGHSNQRDEQFEKRLNYLRRLMEFGAEVRDNTEVFMDTMRNEVFQDRVYVFTPKGDIVDLPNGSTPIDFAYHIHTDVGHRCRGAKVGGKWVGLDYQLKSGEQIEIITTNRGGPSMDWLNDDLGFTKTHRAREKIRHWFRKLNREKHILLGRETLERELRRIALLDKISFEAVAQLFDYMVLEDFLAQVGAGDINAAQIAHRALDDERQRQQKLEENTIKVRPRSTPLVEDKSNGVNVLGTGGLLTNIASCCHPVPGDPIVGYVTRGRGITIHHTECKNVTNLTDLERLIDVSWGNATEEQRYIVPIEVVAYDREALIRDVSTVIADEKINITDVRVTVRQDIATIRINLELSNYRQMTRILNKIGLIKSVTDVYRCASL